MISMKHRFLSVHYPKTGGNSVQEVLRWYSEDSIVCLNPLQDGEERFEVRNDDFATHKHSTLMNYQSVLPADAFDMMYKFTTIRNPWERMISLYFSPHRQITNWDRAEFIVLLAEAQPLRKFVGLDDESEILGSHLDTLMRFEYLDADFQLVCERIGIEYEPLLKRNQSVRRHYSHYYDDELKELVANKFRDEVIFGKYQFGTE